MKLFPAFLEYSQKEFTLKQSCSIQSDVNWN